RRHVTRHRRHEIQLLAPEIPAGGLLPPPEIVSPPARPVFGTLRGDEAREDGALAITGRDRLDGRQHAFHPRRLPEAARGKDVLHVNAEVSGARDLLHRLFPGRHSASPFTATAG